MSEATIRLKWEKGIVPGGSHQSTAKVGRKQGLTQATEDQIAAALKTPEGRERFNEALQGWLNTYPQLSLQHPIKRLKWLSRMEAIADRFRGRGENGEELGIPNPELSTALKNELVTLKELLETSRTEEALIQAQGAPSIIRVLFKDFADLQASSDPSMMHVQQIFEIAAQDDFPE